jgi:hypothetical protein
MAFMAFMPVPRPRPLIVGQQKFRAAIDHCTTRFRHGSAPRRPPP